MRALLFRGLTQRCVAKDSTFAAPHAEHKYPVKHTQPPDIHPEYNMRALLFLSCFGGIRRAKNVICDTQPAGHKHPAKRTQPLNMHPE
jgi:hypothetical protein